MYKLKENYTVGTKGLCSTDLFNEVSLIFVHMVSTGEILLQLLQTKVALFTAFHCIPVDFMFGIDLPENEQICNFMDFFHTADRPKH